MSLSDELGKRLGGGNVASFRLMGEDAVLLTPRELEQATEAYRRRREREVPEPLRARFDTEQQRVADEAYAWLARYNRHLFARIEGYLELARCCRFLYPWPVVAVLGLCQVMAGLRRAYVYGLCGAALQRAGLERISRMAEAMDDSLRRTNRGIFADSVPTVLYALHVQSLRAGDPGLADALVRGPMPLLMDEQSRTLIRDLDRGLGLEGDRTRFAALRELTLRQFAREQAIFSHHLGPGRKRTPRRRSPLRRAARMRSVPAPVVDRARGTLQFEPYPLPEDFDMRNHDQRVGIFSDAFVRSITESIDDYRIAARWIVRRFGRRGEKPDIAYAGCIDG